MSVRSASFTVLRSSSLPKLSFFNISSFCNTFYRACLSPSSYLLLNSIKAFKCSRWLIKSSTIFFLPLSFFSKNGFKVSFQKIKSLFIWVSQCVLLSWIYQKVIPWKTSHLRKIPSSCKRDTPSPGCFFLK